MHFFKKGEENWKNFTRILTCAEDDEKLKCEFISSNFDISSSEENFFLFKILKKNQNKFFLKTIFFFEKFLQEN